MIFAWVGYNIKYNMKGLLCGNFGSNDSNSVLKNKTAVCEGFSNIYMDLCTHVNLKVK